MHRPTGDSKSQPRDGTAAAALPSPPPPGMTNFVPPRPMPPPLYGTTCATSQFPLRSHTSGPSPPPPPPFTSDRPKDSFTNEISLKEPPKPSDPEMIKKIETSASYVVKNGPHPDDLPLEEHGNNSKIAVLVENKRGQGLIEPTERSPSESNSRLQAAGNTRQMQKVPEQLIARNLSHRTNLSRINHTQTVNDRSSSQAPSDDEISRNPAIFKRDEQVHGASGDVGGADSVRDLRRPSNDNIGEKSSVDSKRQKRHLIEQSIMDKSLAIGSTVEGSRSLTVDEFGRLAQEGASESESEGYRRSLKRSRSHNSDSSSSSIRRRSRDRGWQQSRGRVRHWSRSRNRNRNTSRGRGRGRDREKGKSKSRSRSRSNSHNSRSSSHSRSHDPRPRRRSFSRSPQRRKTSSRSYSRSPQRQRNFSRSPPKNLKKRGMGKFERDWKGGHDRHGRGREGERGVRPIPCIHFARGRCSRGNACRFLHGNRQSQGHDALTQDIHFGKHDPKKEADWGEHREERHDRHGWGREPQIEGSSSKNLDARQDYFAEKKLDSLNPGRFLHKQGDTTGMGLNNVSMKGPTAGTVQGKREPFASRGVNRDLEPFGQGMTKEETMRKHDSNQHVTLVESKGPTNTLQNVSTSIDSQKLPGKVDPHELLGAGYAERIEETENVKDMKISQMQGMRLEMETSGNPDARANAIEKNIMATNFVTKDMYAKALDIREMLQEHILKMSLPSTIETHIMNGTDLATKMGMQVETQVKLNFKNEGDENSHVKREINQSPITGHQLHIPTSRMEIPASSTESGQSILPPQNNEVHSSSNTPHGQYYSSSLSQHPVLVGNSPYATPQNFHAHASMQVPGQSLSQCQQLSPTFGTAFYGQSISGTQYSQTVSSGAAQYLHPSNLVNVASVLLSDSEAALSQKSKPGVPDFVPNIQPSLSSPSVMHTSAPTGQSGHSSVAQNMGVNLPFRQTQHTLGIQGFDSSVALQSQQTTVTHPIMGAKISNISNTMESQPSAATQNNASWLFHSAYNQGVPQLLPTGPSSSYSYALTKVPPLSDLVKVPESNSLPDQYDPLSDVLVADVYATTKTAFPDSLGGMKPAVSVADTQGSISENISGAMKSIQQATLDATEVDGTNDTTGDVGTVDNHSPENWSPGLPGHKVETQSDQQPLTKKGSRGLKMLRAAVAEHVKEVLKPTWREGYMSKEAFKTIAKKAVDKVIGNLPNHHIPKTPEKVEQFMKSSRPKISKLVQGYVDKYLKL